MSYENYGRSVVVVVVVFGVVGITVVVNLKQI